MTFDPVNKILGDTYSKNKDMPVKEIEEEYLTDDVLPHKCVKCDEFVRMSNRVYYKGNYYHNECFNKRRRKTK